MEIHTHAASGAYLVSKYLNSSPSGVFSGPLSRYTYTRRLPLLPQTTGRARAVPKGHRTPPPALIRSHTTSLCISNAGGKQVQPEHRLMVLGLPPYTPAVGGAPQGHRRLQAGLGADRRVHAKGVRVYMNAMQQALWCTIRLQAARASLAAQVLDTRSSERCCPVR